MSRRFKGQMTPDHSKPPLCESCSNGQVLRGFASSQHVTFCHLWGEHARVPFPIYECSEYEQKGAQNLHDLREIAWSIKTHQGKFLGFVPPKRKTDDE